MTTEQLIQLNVLRDIEIMLLKVNYTMSHEDFIDILRTLENKYLEALKK